MYGKRLIIADTILWNTVHSNFQFATTTTKRVQTTTDVYGKGLLNLSVRKCGRLFHSDTKEVKIGEQE